MCYSAVFRIFFVPPLSWPRGTNMVAAGGISPLLAACKAGHTDILEMLLDHDGVDVNRTGAGAEAAGPQGGAEDVSHRAK